MSPYIFGEEIREEKTEKRLESKGWGDKRAGEEGGSQKRAQRQHGMAARGAPR